MRFFWNIALIIGLSLTANASVALAVNSGSVSAVLNDPGHSDFKVLSEVSPQMIRLFNASGTIVARNGRFGIVFSAFHIRPEGWVGWNSDLLKDSKGDTYYRYPSLVSLVDGAAPKNSSAYPPLDDVQNLSAIPSQIVFHSTVDLPGNIFSGENMQFIKPENDFMVGIIAEPKDGGYKLPALPTQPKFRDAIPGEEVIAVGFPSEKSSKLSYSVGVVQTDKDAQIFREQIIDRGVDLNFAVETLFTGYVTPGFSGGAVFGRDGKFLGVISRGAPYVAKPFARFISAKYILRSIIEQSQKSGAEKFRALFGEEFLKTSSD